MSVRVRFAPSPTGPLHIGGVRTALFNYLFAKKNNGTFILRIEDTDQTRYVKGAEKYIAESLNWCGIDFDEGITKGGPYEPYKQSERKTFYKQYADELLKAGKAYYAFDTPEELDEKRKQFETEKKVFAYDVKERAKLRNSLTLPEEQVKEIIDSGQPYVIRFKTPDNEELIMHDIIRGEIQVNTSTLDDKVLFKSDGLPTYHLANVVDDHLMEISHVIRGEEWLPSLPLHVLLYRALGWEKEMPLFAHLPLILKPSGQGKLSKRDGDKLGFPVFPLEWKDPASGEVSPGYREFGYFPEAFVNILAFLGWNPGTEQEIFSMDELIKTFNLDKVGKSGARFDPEKAKWYNQQYLRMKSDEELAELFQAELIKKGIQKDVDFVKKVVALVKERAVFIKDLWEQAHFLFNAPESYDPGVVKKRWKPEIPGHLSEIARELKTVEPFTAENFKSVVTNYVDRNNLGFGNIMNAVRLALVGSSMGPDLGIMAEMLGKEEVVFRIEKAVKDI